MSEVKDMESQVLRALGKTPNKKTLKISNLNSISTIFKEGKMERF